VTAAASQHAGAVTSGRAGWLAALRFSALVYLGVRLGLLLVGLLSTALLPVREPVGVPGWPATLPSAGWHHVFTAWERHDALWFLRIAADGYRPDDGSGAFFPLYPLLTRAVGTALGGHWLLGAYVVSNVALVVALTVLYRLTERELSALAARRTVLYLAVFPTAFFLYAPYTESLFLALVLGSLYAARRSAWLLAGGLGALAALTRSTGLLLVLPLVVEAALQAREVPGPGRPRRLAGALAASGLVPVGTAAYLLYWHRTEGDALRPLELQSAQWSREGSWPWETLLAGAREGVRYFGSYPGGYHTVDLVVVLVAVLAGGWVALRMRATYGVWVAVSLLVPLTLSFDGRPLLSLPRFVVVVFPLFWALARLAERWRVHDAVVAASAAGLGLLSVLFVNWYYIF
jgi:hypothetical protein